MKTTLKTSLRVLGTGALSCLLAATSLAQSGTTKDSKSRVRILQNQDGSITEFRGSSDQRVLERRTFGERKNGAKDRVLRMTIIYRKDKLGKLRSGQILDGKGDLLYRVRYGYNKHDGRLVAEQMFDARVKRTHVVTVDGVAKTVEKPVRRLYHRYDAQGRRAKPIVITTIHGKKADELFGPNGSSHVDDPFKNR
ncbi:MAG: hypothetical protein ACPG32_10880 [Akkermansiaceae bacterium]